MSKDLAKQIGYKALELINEQVEQGIDIDGKKYSYSTKPFFMPYSRKAVQKMGKENKGKLYNIVKSKGRKGLIILGGYRLWREVNDRNPDGDFLQWTGNMLASMDVINATDEFAELGFRDKKSAKIAYYLNVTGAGKGRKLWKFFGLTKENQEKLAEMGDKLTEADVRQFVDKHVARLLK